MWMPMAIAATAMMPRMEKLKRRMGSVRLPLIDQHGVQEQEEPDEAGEIDDIAQRDDAAGEIGEALDDGHPSGDGTQDRYIGGQEVIDDRVGGDGEDEADGNGEDKGDDLVAG